MADERLDRARGGGDTFDPHACGNPKAVEQIEEVLGREIAGGAWRVRTSAKPAGRRIEDADACLEAGVDVDQRRATRVVKMERQVRRRDALHDVTEHVGDLCGVRDSDGVADRYLVGAEIDQPRGQVGNALGRHRPFEGAAEAGREIRPNRQFHRPRLVGDLLGLSERLVDGLVDVALAEGLGRRGEHRDLVHPGLAGTRQPMQVRYERGIPHAWPPRNPGADLRRVGHLRHPLWADECGHLDRRVTGFGKPVYERDLVGRRHERRLVLEAVAWADLDDPGAGRKGCSHLNSYGVSGLSRTGTAAYSSSTSGMPG